MLKNYLKTGLRNLFRHKAFAVINILGLGFGIACCLLISLFVRDEFTFDAYHNNVNSIYNLSLVTTIQDQERVLNAVAYPEAKTFYEEVPEVINYARMRNEGAVVNANNDLFDEKGLFFTDKGLFEMFDFKVVDGALDQSLENLESLVITESTAIKYFGSPNVAGKELMIKVREEFDSFIVGAVIEDHPSNSSFTFNMIMSWAKLETIIDDWTMNFWSITPISAYLQLSENSDLALVHEKIQASRLRHTLGDGGEPTNASESVNKLIALKDYHFEKRGGEERKSQSYLLSGIGLLILVIASFNFSTLTIVNSIRRAKEVGVRKTIGATRKHLVFQFIVEASFLSMISFILGIVIAEFTLPLFEVLVEKEFTSSLMDDLSMLVFMLTLVFVVTLISVIYPSVYLARLKVVNVLKDKVKVGGKRYLTRSMVALQFFCAFVFITVAVVINEQHQFLMNKDKGYSDENVIRLKIPSTNSFQIAQRFKNELEGNINILSVGASSNLNEAVRVKDTLGHEETVIQGVIDQGYLSTLKIDLLEGREFTSEDFVELDDYNSIQNVVINKSTIEALDMAEPIGRVIGDGKYRIVGVIEDFQVFSATSSMNSIMLSASTRPGRKIPMNNIYIKYSENQLPEVVAAISNVWDELLPLEPFQYTFLDEYNRNLYKKEALWSKTLTYSSTLAIAISLMGLLGLVGLSASQRKKEVSIRKVLGASVGNLLLLLNQGFMRMLLLSMLLSIPIAYYIVNQILQDYINRIEITALLFAMPLLATFLVAWLTVSSITFKSANTNPVNELRNE